MGVMNTAAEVASLRKATRIAFKSARRFVQEARKAATPGIKAGMLNFVQAERQNIRSYRAKIAAYEAQS